MKKAAAVIAVLVMCFISISVNAEIDLSKKGSITVNLHDINGTSINEVAQFYIYRIGDAKTNENGLYFAKNDKYALCSAKYNQLKLAQEVNKVIEYTKKNNISPETKYNPDNASVNNDGKFTNVDAGLYLIIMYADVPDEFEYQEGFVVEMPLPDPSSAGNHQFHVTYRVVAEPKVIHRHKPEITPPIVTPTPTGETPSPTPDELITPSPDATPTPGKPNHTPGGNVTPPPKLPQTGMLVWPIPVLAGAGMMLVVLGLVMLAIEKKK